MEKSTPIISIIVPIYNQEKYLGKCIRSVLNQTFQNYEIILVNDGSTDKSLKLCRKYAESDPRITVIDKQNEGLAFARRDGFLKASGEYVCFLDSDDYLATDALEELYNLAQEKGVDMVVGSYDIVYDSFGLIKRKSHPYSVCDEEIPNEAVLRCLVGYDGNMCNWWKAAVWGRLIKYSCLYKAYCESSYSLFPNNTAIEDNAFNLALAPYVESMWVSGKLVCHYRYGGVTSKAFPVVRRGATTFDDRYDGCIRYHCEEVLPQILRHYAYMLRSDVIGQYHYHVQPEHEIMAFARKEMNTRKIVLWARQHQTELPEDLKNDALVESILNSNVDEFIKMVHQREAFLKKHHYWKMKILEYYQEIANMFNFIFDRS